MVFALAFVTLAVVVYGGFWPLIFIHPLTAGFITEAVWLAFLVLIGLGVFLGDPRRVKRWKITWKEQDCPDDAPDGRCWYCRVPSSEPHRASCRVHELADN